MAGECVRTKPEEWQLKGMGAGGRVALAALLLGALLLLIMGGALCMGASGLAPAKTLGILWGELVGDTRLLEGFRESERAIVWDIRLPRILCGALVGMGLGVAGAVFQPLLRNPLADPYTLGVSTGAAFGASLAILLNITLGIALPTTGAAFGFAFLTLVAVILIAERGGGMLTSNLVLAGIIVSAVLSSGISFIKMTAGENVSAIVFWLMGSLSSRSWRDVAVLAPFVLVCSALCLVFAGDLNVMTLGDERARALGVNTRRVRMIYLVLGSCITAACVSVSGIIGFIGLVVPHILRFWLAGTTSDNRSLIPLCALLGGVLLCAADNATRLLSAGEIPVGVLTTLLGGPFFIYVFLRGPRRSGE